MKIISKFAFFTALLMLAGVAFAQTPVFEEEGDEVFVQVEDTPQFPDGLQAMSKFLAENIQYPQEAKENGITGKVYVTFVVEKDGSISNIKVLRDIGGGCGAEVVRVVGMMPRWTPGKLQSKPVRCQFKLPVQFNLNESEPDQRNFIQRIFGRK